jgi:hypothetical protein
MAHCCRGRHAVSSYQVLELLAAGGAAHTAWRLRTGRTHQIRVHARHLGHALLGDDSYGGAGGAAVSAISRGQSARHAQPPPMHIPLMPISQGGYIPPTTTSSAGRAIVVVAVEWHRVECNWLHST